LKILIKNIIKGTRPGPVGAGLVPVQSGQGKSVPIGVYGSHPHKKFPSDHSEIVTKFASLDGFKP
jgi:hypothetical protein